MLAVAPPLDDAFLDEARQALAEDVARHPERLLELVEAAPAEEQIAQHRLGSAIGVAVLIALLNDSTGGDLMAGLRRGWWFLFAAGLGTAALALAIGPIGAPASKRAPSPEPAPM